MDKGFNGSMTNLLILEWDYVLDLLALGNLASGLS